MTRTSCPHSAQHPVLGKAWPERARSAPRASGPAPTPPSTPYWESQARDAPKSFFSFPHSPEHPLLGKTGNGHKSPCSCPCSHSDPCWSSQENSSPIFSPNHQHQHPSHFLTRGLDGCLSQRGTTQRFMEGESSHGSGLTGLEAKRAYHQRGASALPLSRPLLGSLLLEIRFGVNWS